MQRPLLTNIERAYLFVMTDIYSQIVSKDNLYMAARRALRCKLSSPRFFAYYVNISANVERIHKSIMDGSYRQHNENEFDLWCISGQKMRHIVVPSPDDLVVQHAIYQIIVPIIDPKLIFDSYGCRIGKGSHRAANRCQQFLRQSPKDSYYLQTDVRKYYYNLDHEILKSILFHLLHDQRAVDFIAMQFPLNATIGMNVGAMISQLMGMVYLNQFDHYVKRVLKIKHYIRYVDDAVFIGMSKQECHDIAAVTSEYLTRLKLGYSKIKVAPIRKGINFVGYRAWQDKRIIRKRSYKTFNQNLRKGKIESLQASLGHALHTSSHKQLVARIENSRPELLTFLKY